jgi:hypothetical protein
MTTLQEQIAAIRMGVRVPQKVPALMKMTGDIPWELCAMIKVSLANPRREFAEPGDHWDQEHRRWIDAGAIPTGTEATKCWLKERSNPERPCDQCGRPKSGTKPGRLFTLTSKGFGWHALCGHCYQGYTLFDNPWMTAVGYKEVAP